MPFNILAGMTTSESIAGCNLCDMIKSDKLGAFGGARPDGQERKHRGVV
jgi:hypothetical protein